MNIFDVKSKEQLDTFFTKNEVIPEYPMQYPCKIVIDIITGTQKNYVACFQFVYNSDVLDGLEDFDVQFYF